MTAVAVPTPVEASIRLDGIRWQTYEALRDDLEAQHRHLRLTYYSDTLEIVSPSPEPELYKKTAGRLVETLAISTFPDHPTVKIPQPGDRQQLSCFDPRVSRVGEEIALSREPSTGKSAVVIDDSFHRCLILAQRQLSW